MGEDAKRLAILEARAEIADLVHTYARNVREGQGGSCGDLFTEDGHFEVRRATSFAADDFEVTSQVSGPAEINAYVGRSSASGARLCPLISNLIISVDGERAESRCVMTNTILSTGQQMMGEYHDLYRLEGRWLFTSRIFTIVAARSS